MPVSTCMARSFWVERSAWVCRVVSQELFPGCAVVGCYTEAAIRATVRLGVCPTDGSRLVGVVLVGAR